MNIQQLLKDNRCWVDLVVRGNPICGNPRHGYYIFPDGQRFCNGIDEAVPPLIEAIEALTSSGWAVTRVEHPALRLVREACDECLSLAETAIDHARVTGSVGCTYSDGNHSATVTRVVKVITR